MLFVKGAAKFINRYWGIAQWLGRDAINRVSTSVHQLIEILETNSNVA